MAYEFKLPDLGEGLTEGEVARWLVAEGQEIAEDDPLVEIQTDKTTVEIPSPAAGTVSRILVAEGEVAPVGAVLVVIGDDGDVADAGRAEGACRAGDRKSRRRQARPPGRAIQATPLVRRIAQELGVDLARVDRHRAGRPRHRGRRARPRLAERAHRRGQAGAAPGRAARIAEHMARAHREVPAVTLVEECDFDGGRPRAARADCRCRRARAR